MIEFIDKMDKIFITRKIINPSIKWTNFVYRPVTNFTPFHPSNQADVTGVELGLGNMYG